jgi:hypothetical protein
LQHVINYRDGYICGWDSVIGDGTQSVDKTITFGKTFIGYPIVIVYPWGYCTDPADLDSFQTGLDGLIYWHGEDLSTTTVKINMFTDTGTTFVGTNYYGLTWVAFGKF